MIANQPTSNDRKGTMVFVVGNSRSGTTMMGRILGNHPTIFTFRELHFFEQLWSGEDGTSVLSKDEAIRLTARLLSVQREGYLTQKDPKRFFAEAGVIATSMEKEKIISTSVFEYFLRYESLINGKSIPCDQTPRNVFYIGEILKSYPGARIINMTRDPRDVLSSQKEKWRRHFLGAKNIPLKEAFRTYINYHPITISKLWNASQYAAERFSSEHQVYSVCFENLISDPGGTINRVCEFLGLGYLDNLLEIPQIGSSHKKDHPEQKGISREMAGSWERQRKLNSSEIFLCQKITKTSMGKHGYRDIPICPNPLLLIYYILQFPFKLIVAFFLNIKRMRNIKEVLRKRMT